MAITSKRLCKAQHSKMKLYCLVSIGAAQSFEEQNVSGLIRNWASGCVARDEELMTDSGNADA